MSDVIDSFGVVAQVQGVVSAYGRLRDEKAALEAKVFQLNQDVARLEKLVKSLQQGK